MIPEILEGEEATPVQHPGARIRPPGRSQVTLAERRAGGVIPSARNILE